MLSEHFPLWAVLLSGGLCTAPFYAWGRRNGYRALRYTWDRGYDAGTADRNATIEHRMREGWRLYMGPSGHPVWHDTLADIDPFPPQQAAAGPGGGLLSDEQYRAGLEAIGAHDAPPGPALSSHGSGPGGGHQPQPWPADKQRMPVETPRAAGPGLAIIVPPAFEPDPPLYAATLEDAGGPPPAEDEISWAAPPRLPCHWHPEGHDARFGTCGGPLSGPGGPPLEPAMAATAEAAAFEQENDLDDTGAWHFKVENQHRQFCYANGVPYHPIDWLAAD